MIMRMKWLCVCLPLMVSGMSLAQVFPDNEARRAILDLRADVKRITEDNKKNFDKIQSDKQASDLELKKSNDLIARLQQSLRDSQLEASRLQQEIDKLIRLQNQAVLQLKADNDALKQQIAEVRGEREQLAKDISVLQRSQKDFSSGLEDRFYKLDQRFNKIEPVMVQIDGLEFQSDQAEKKDYELALSTFKRGEYTGAVNAFTVFLRKYPNSGFRQSALFWVASAKFVKGDYTDTANQLRAFLGMNEAHARYPEAMLTYANAQIELKLPADAKKTLEDLIRDYPNSEAAKAASERLAKLKLL
jgi:tol-pal system protein YbgF